MLSTRSWGKLRVKVLGLRLSQLPASVEQQFYCLTLLVDGILELHTFVHSINTSWNLSCPRLDTGKQQEQEKISLPFGAYILMGEIENRQVNFKSNFCQGQYCENNKEHKTNSGSSFQMLSPPIHEHEQILEQRKIGMLIQLFQEKVKK